MKRFLTLLLSLTMALSVFSVSTVYSENEYFYGVWETDSEFFKLSDATNWTFKREYDSLASGGYAMKYFNLNGTFDNSKRLYTDDLEVDKDGKYKLFARIKGCDTIDYSVNNGQYNTGRGRFNNEEYKWIYIDEIELYSYESLQKKGTRKQKYHLFCTS